MYDRYNSRIYTKLLDSYRYLRFDRMATINLLVLIVLYTTNMLFLRHEFELYNSYFNDLLAMPILLTCMKTAFIWQNMPFPSYMVWVFWITSSFIWEYVYPAINPSSTADWFDVLAYFLGTFIWRYLNKEGINNYNMRQCCHHIDHVAKYIKVKRSPYIL